MLGQVETSVKYEDQEGVLPFLVITGKGANLIGRNWLLLLSTMLQSWTITQSYWRMSQRRMRQSTHSKDFFSTIDYHMACPRPLGFPAYYRNPTARDSFGCCMCEWMIYSGSNGEEHLANLEEVLKWLSEHG